MAGIHPGRDDHHFFGIRLVKPLELGQFCLGSSDNPVGFRQYFSLPVHPVIAFCFFLGLAVRTRLGTIFHGLIEKEVLERIPGYSTTWIGNLEENSKLALVRPFDNNTLVTGFITDKNDDETYTVFVPTGPNPTSGSIFHIEKDRVYFVGVPVDAGMKSVTSCGAGSCDIIKKYKKKSKKAAAV